MIDSINYYIIIILNMEGDFKKIRGFGLKVTPQRLAIFSLVKADRTHPSAQEVYQEVARKHPEMSFATVYNTLSKLVEAGAVQELNIDPDKKRFDPRTSLHDHFYCRVCGKVYDVDGDVSLAPNIKTIAGHRVETVQLTFKGVCEACSRK